MVHNLRRNLVCRHKNAHLTPLSLQEACLTKKERETEIIVNQKSKSKLALVFLLLCKQFEAVGFESLNSYRRTQTPHIL